MNTIRRIVAGICGCIVVAQFSACAARSTSWQFDGPGGQTIELDVEEGVFLDQFGNVRPLRDCGDALQFCLTDDRDFAFSFAKTCGLPQSEQKLKFSPNVIWALHNDSWVVFDESPGFMFHHVVGEGIVGIYAGAPEHPDFRDLLRSETSGPAAEGLREFTIQGSQSLAACTN